MAEPRIAEPILHVDMDAFFVEVERLDDPELVGVPVVVGGDGARGVVASASYEARRHGVRSAMPMGMAKRRCPGLRVVPPRHDRYRRVSLQVFEIFRDVTPLVQGLSLDEAFLDVSGLRHHHETGGEVAAVIRQAIRQATELPASVGVATTMFLAKLASGRAKPDGVFVVEAGDERAFLAELAVAELWGVGAATQAALRQLGIETVGELSEVPEAVLRRRLGDSIGPHLLRLAQGIDERAVTPDGDAKSISAEQTYNVDLSGLDTVTSELLRHSDHVAYRLRRAGLAGRTIAIKVRYDDFETVTRSITLAGPTDVTRDIYRAAHDLAQRLAPGDRPIRLLGVGVSALTENATPRQLATDRPAQWDDLADAVHDVRRRFGRGAVEPARLKAPTTQPATGNENRTDAYNGEH